MLRELVAIKTFRSDETENELQCASVMLVLSFSTETVSKNNNARQPANCQTEQRSKMDPLKKTVKTNALVIMENMNVLLITIISVEAAVT